MFIIHRITKHHDINKIRGHIERDKKKYTCKINPEKTKENEMSNRHITTGQIKQKYKARKNAVIGIEGLYTASPEFFEGKTRDEINQFFRECKDFHMKHYGEKIICYGIHYDETTPHMHIITAPEWEGKLNAKHYINGPEKLVRNQTEIATTIGKKWGLDRGQPHSRTVHQSTLTKWAEEIIEREKELNEWENNLDKMTYEQALKIIQDHEKRNEIEW